MSILRSIVSLSSLVLLLGACATGRDAVMQVANEKYTGKVVSIAEFDTKTKMGYTIRPEGLKLLSDLGVVCKDDDVALQKAYTKLGSVAYCENGAMDKNHVMLVKIAIAPDGNSGNVMAKHFNAWTLQTGLFTGDGNLTCVDLSHSRTPQENSFADCTFTYRGKKYFTMVVFFTPVTFDNVRQILLVGNVQDASEEAKNKTWELTEKISYSFKK